MFSSGNVIHGHHMLLTWPLHQKEEFSRGFSCLRGQQQKMLNQAYRKWAVL